VQTALDTSAGADAPSHLVSTLPKSWPVAAKIAAIARTHGV